MIVADDPITSPRYISHGVWNYLSENAPPQGVSGLGMDTERHRCRAGGVSLVRMRPGERRLNMLK